MNKLSLLVCSALFFGGLLPLAQAQKLAGIQVVVHDNCNEIKLENTDNDGWRAQLEGGTYRTTDQLFGSLNQNNLGGVHFGPQGSAINLKFTGKKIVPASIESSHPFSTEVWSVSKSSDSSIYGKFIGLTDGDFKARQIADKSSSSGFRDRLLFAVIYLNYNDDGGPLTAKCAYASGDINTITAGSQCIWIDSFSRAANGKPYCW